LTCSSEDGGDVDHYHHQRLVFGLSIFFYLACTIAQAVSRVLFIGTQAAMLLRPASIWSIRLPVRCGFPARVRSCVLASG
jgi:hypothetical protein